MLELAQIFHVNHQMVKRLCVSFKSIQNYVFSIVPGILDVLIYQQRKSTSILVKSPVKFRNQEQSEQGAVLIDMHSHTSKTSWLQGCGTTLKHYNVSNHYIHIGQALCLIKHQIGAFVAVLLYCLSKTRTNAVQKGVCLALQYPLFDQLALDANVLDIAIRYIGDIYGGPFQKH